MTRRMVAALAVCGWLTACGGSSLPGTDSPSTTNPDGTVDLPGDPTDGTDDPDGQESTSLWPLTEGSTWTYRITDPVLGVFNKKVDVVGLREVPDTQGKMQAMLVHSRQDRTSAGMVYEEYSYQLELTNGLVVRLREEDHKDSQLVRTTTWSPATVKSLSRVPTSAQWSYQDAVRELTVLGDGSTEDGDPTFAWRVVEMNATVQTPAGTFTNAIKIQRDKLNDAGEVKAEKTRTYWLVPGVGKVREEGERTEELTAYDIQK